MSDLFDEFNRILKKDLLFKLIKYFKDPNNKIPENISDFLKDQGMLLTDILERISKSKDNDINQENYTDIDNNTEIDKTLDHEYDDLFSRLIVIEENMIQIEKILKDKN